uniref:Beaded filament structural protein 2, phakinin n=1 Tax=Neolamprologus brichardi TaxID=32507 RepID=A0A3Q4MYK9_NEOBR
MLKHICRFRSSRCLSDLNASASVLIVMPLPRRRSSFLGQTAAERPPSASCGRMGSAGTSAPRGVFVGSTPPASVPSGLGTRVSRRALGISSVFLQGMRSSTTPVLPRGSERAAGSGAAAGLNSCLMEYRDKVRALEQLNQQLEEQIRLCLDRKASSAGAWGPLRREWEEVYRQVRGEGLNTWLHRHTVLHPIGMQKCEPKKCARAAVHEQPCTSSPDFLSEQDVRILYSQMAGRDVDEPDAPIETSLDQILAYIRSHWEKVMEKSRAETDTYLDCKVRSSHLPEEEQVEALKAECSDTGCKIQSLQAETESIRALKRGLENSLSDARHWHDMELQNLGSVVAKLEAELADIRSEIEQQRRDYDTLLSNKQRLEQEIDLYHGILDGEENRFETL